MIVVVTGRGGGGMLDRPPTTASRPAQMPSASQEVNNGLIEFVPSRPVSAFIPGQVPR